MSNFKLGIVIPTYNEKENIAEILSLVKGVSINNNLSILVLVMDDSSPDGTSNIVKEIIKGENTEKFQVELKVRPGKQGLASAYKQGFTQIKDRVDYLVSMDADLSHSPKYLIDMLERISSGADYIIGSRYVDGGGVKGWSKFRLFISYFGSFYSRSILGVPIKDFTGGYNMYRSELFSVMNLDSVKAEGYLFQIEMKYILFKLGFKPSEVPIIFADRTRGKSKISRKIILEAFLGVFGLRISDVNKHKHNI